MVGPAAAIALHDRIVVTAERLRAIEVSVGQDSEGRWQCALSASSGTAWIDDRLCRTTTGCVRRHGEDRGKVAACVATHRSGIIADLSKAVREERR